MATTRKVFLPCICGHTSLVVLDSLNYIKGYRYELYCISKAAGERHGVVWIMGSAADEACAAGSSPSDELAKERNLRRKRQWQENPPSTASSDGDVINDGYYGNDATMDELVMRFEPPDKRNRWEKPLYKVDMSRVLPWDKNGTLKQSAMATNKTNGDSRLTQSMASVTLQDDRPAVQPIKSAAGFKRNKNHEHGIQKSCRSSSNTTNNSNSNSNTDMTTIEQVIDDILNSFFIDIQPLKEGLSTLTHSSAESNVLNLVDATSQRINIEIIKAQTSMTAAGGRIVIPLGGSNVSSGKERVIALKQSISVNELRNVRKQYLKWMASHPLSIGTVEEEDTIAENYIQYIESHM
ncbi:hypothetical protein HJC23_013374 [Cyclotella cryptica]|uniref:Uncharacterized protein n=1 Tax=Cyclotella cryptica TaxID=29204 RepID=A0ABD3NJW8_9STRA